ncbi:MAG: hypothetical protein HY301_08605 [Verrucomicrobia bacterium]|nr:hypothetical protein [Verrucomicrobiota bacterium]
MRLTPAVLAHNPDTSYARIRIAEDKLELRFTYDLVTLLKIAKLDERGTGLVTRADLKKHAPEIFAYLRKHITLEVNAREADLGDAGAFGWAADVGESVPQKDFHSAAALIHFHFTQPLDDLPEDVSIEFDFFREFGERHTVQGEFELKGEKHEVVFTRFEPDYLFNTGYEPTLARRIVVFLKRGGGIVVLVLLLAPLLWLVKRRLATAA